MKKRVGVAEFKARLSEYLRSVRGGHELAIYDREQPVARVVPYQSSGVLTVREPSRKYGALRDVPLPGPLPLEVDPVDLLLEDRAEDLNAGS
jgi:prevent-host-death family protein